MTYRKDNRIKRYVKGYGLMSFAKKGFKNFESKYGKMLKSKDLTKVLKSEGKKIGKLAGKQLSDKIILSGIDVAGSKIADKITSLKSKDLAEDLKVKDDKTPEIEEDSTEIIIPPEKRQQILNDLRLF